MYKVIKNVYVMNAMNTSFKILLQTFIWTEILFMYGICL